MLLQNKKVAIVGGGPGGLTLARLLQLKGVDVKVYERDRDKSFRQQGATLDLHYESGLKALREDQVQKELPLLTTMQWCTIPSVTKNQFRI